MVCGSPWAVGPVSPQSRCTPGRWRSVGTGMTSAASHLSWCLHSKGSKQCHSISPGSCSPGAYSTIKCEVRTKKKSVEPRWRWFANATPRETGFRILPLPRAEFGRLTLEWHNWLVTPREGGGLSNLGCRIKKHLGLLELRQMGERMRLEEAVSLSGSLDPLRAARDEVYAVDLRLAWGGSLKK